MYKKLLIIGLFHSFTVFCQIQGRVIRVLDGDTYEVLINGKKETIRLANIDAPEKDQAFGKNAKDSVSKIILNEFVRVEFTGSTTYNRKVAEIFIHQMALDSLLVAKGYAWHYAIFSTKNSLKIVEENARFHRKGIWLCPDPVPPWIWRKFTKFNKRLWNVCQ